MAWRYHSKNVIDPNNSQGQGCCDRCYDAYPLHILQFQMDWQGSGLINKQLRVCPRCYDKPQPQLRAIRIPADPLPLMNPRPNSYAMQMDNSSPVLTYDQPYGRWDDGVSTWDMS